jgi:hypothetical protein
LNQRYCDILYPIIGQLIEDEIARFHFQQDSATVHTARVSMALLRDVFSDRLVSGNIIWPPRSPDITPPDFCLWGAMKGAVYKDNPHSLLDKEEGIT